MILPLPTVLWISIDIELGRVNTNQGLGECLIYGTHSKELGKGSPVLPDGRIKNRLD